MKTYHRFDLAAKPMAAVLCAVFGLAGLAFDAAAATTDISSTPMVTTAPNAVKPNVMFILDDSGSMDRDYMPDDADFESGKYGRQAAQCNGLAYNPNLTDVQAPGRFDGCEFPCRRLHLHRAERPAEYSLGAFDGSDRRVEHDDVDADTERFGTTAYGVNNLITLYSNDDLTKYMVGVITAVNAGSDQLTIRFTDFQGSGAITSPRVGDGDFRPFYFNYNTYSGSPAKLSYSYASGPVSTRHQPSTASATAWSVTPRPRAMAASPRWSWMRRR